MFEEDAVTISAFVSPPQTSSPYVAGFCTNSALSWGTPRAGGTLRVLPAPRVALELSVVISFLVDYVLF